MNNSLRVYEKLVKENINVCDLYIILEYTSYLENNDIIRSEIQKVKDLEIIKDLYLDSDYIELYDIVENYFENEKVEDEKI